MNITEDIVFPSVMIGFALALILGGVPVMVLAERKIIAFVQNRPGPNRVGPWGLLQTLADGVKLLMKEDILPSAADKWLFILAPMMVFAPAILILAVVPFAPNWQYSEDLKLTFGIANLNIGVLYYFAITSLAVYGIIFAGWASNNKYSVLGGLRSSAQLISYELPLALSVIGVFLLSSSFNVYDIIDKQAGGFWHWNFFAQPLAFLIFLTAGFAETNRLPFDLPEGESELGGGFHTEYSSMKFAMFFLAEYANIFVFSAILSTLFLGGYRSPIETGLTGGWAVAEGMFWFFAKVSFFIFFFIFIRATLPRFRYDHLMKFGWQVMLPLALGNIVWTAFVIAMADTLDAQKAILFFVGVAATIGVDRYLTAQRRKLLDATA